VPDIQVMRAIAHSFAARLTRHLGDERGEVTEKVIITAIFAALAIAVGAIIVLKVTSKANSIPTQ
jgi:hypothetical protein